MSTLEISVDDLTDRTEFNTALSLLIEAADTNDLDISGGYEAETAEQRYGIEIYRVT